MVNDEVLNELQSLRIDLIREIEKSHTLAENFTHFANEQFEINSQLIKRIEKLENKTKSLGGYSAGGGTCDTIHLSGGGSGGVGNR